MIKAFAPAMHKRIHNPPKLISQTDDAFKWKLTFFARMFLLLFRFASGKEIKKLGGISEI
jgi:hypothetical protein